MNAFFNLFTTVVRLCSSGTRCGVLTGSRWYASCSIIWDCVQDAILIPRKGLWLYWYYLQWFQRSCAYSVVAHAVAFGECFTAAEFGDRSAISMLSGVNVVVTCFSLSYSRLCYWRLVQFCVSTLDCNAWMQVCDPRRVAWTNVSSERLVWRACLTKNSAALCGCLLKPNLNGTVLVEQRA